VSYRQGPGEAAEPGSQRERFDHTGERVDVPSRIDNIPSQPPAQDLLKDSAKLLVDRPGGALGLAQIAGGALVNWWRAATLEGLCVGLVWWIGLRLLHVPLAALWAMVAALAAFIPHFGGAMSVIGPVLAVAVSGHDYYRLGLVLGLYAVIVVLDQLVIQPLLLKRTTRVPIWLSILAPIALGIVIPFWGVLLAPPLLAVVFAFRKPKQE
jgi:predicted PurR-regulated permease PerM